MTNCYFGVIWESSPLALLAKKLTVYTLRNLTTNRFAAHKSIVDPPIALKGWSKATKPMPIKRKTTTSAVYASVWTAVLITYLLACDILGAAYIFKQIPLVTMATIPDSELPSAIK